MNLSLQAIKRIELLDGRCIGMECMRDECPLIVYRSCGCDETKSGRGYRLDLCAKWRKDNDCVKQSNWTKELPTVAGYYWVKHPDLTAMCCPMLVVIEDPNDDIPSGDKLLCEPLNLWVVDMDGYEWYGPLHPPL